MEYLPDPFCLHDVDIFDRKVIMALNKALKEASDNLGLKVIKKMRPEYNAQWPINHFSINFKNHVLQVKIAFERGSDFCGDSNLEKIIENYIYHPVRKWGLTPYYDDIYQELNPHP